MRAVVLNCGSMCRRGTLQSGDCRLIAAASEDQRSRRIAILPGVNEELAWIRMRERFSSRASAPSQEIHDLLVNDSNLP